MKITTYLSAAALVLALIVIGPASQARARNFSNSSLFGTFTSLVVSTNIAPNGVSRYVFDGQGNYTRTLILMGTPPGPCTFTETGTYSVNPDGTGTFNGTFATNGPRPGCLFGPLSVNTGIFVLGGAHRIHETEISNQGFFLNQELTNE